MPSPQESVKQLQKELATESQLLQGLEQTERDARARHEKSLKNFEDTQRLIMASQGNVDKTRNDFQQATEAYGAQMSKVQRLKGRIQALGGLINHSGGAIDDQALKRAEEQQRLTEAKMQVPAA